MATVTYIFTILLIIISSSFIPLISPHTLKTTHFQFYLYDKLSSPNPTSIQIAGPTSRSSFGHLVMIDDALLESPNNKSRVIGRAQGLYAQADQTTIALLMVVNYVFTEGKYNGSSLSVLGRNAVLQPVRELPILGGTGLFRFARGFALASTKSFNITTGDAIVEYNVTVQC